jgi:hypothetical protein
MSNEQDFEFCFLRHAIIARRIPKNSLASWDCGHQIRPACLPSVVEHSGLWRAVGPDVLQGLGRVGCHEKQNSLIWRHSLIRPMYSYCARHMTFLQGIHDEY